MCRDEQGPGRRDKEFSDRESRGRRHSCSRPTSRAQKRGTSPVDKQAIRTDKSPRHQRSSRQLQQEFQVSAAFVNLRRISRISVFSENRNRREKKKVDEKRNRSGGEETLAMETHLVILPNSRDPRPAAPPQRHRPSGVCPFYCTLDTHGVASPRTSTATDVSFCLFTFSMHLYPADSL